MFSPAVYLAAQPLEKFGPFLCFVQNYQTVAVDEILPAQVEGDPVGLLFKIKVVPPDGPGQRCFSRLSWPNQRYSGVFGKPLLNEMGIYSFYHVLHFRNQFLICKVFFGGFAAGGRGAG